MHAETEPLPTADDLRALEAESARLLGIAQGMRDAPPADAEAAWRAAYDAQGAARRARNLAMATWRRVEAVRA